MERKQKTKEITIKTTQINNSIKINCAQQFTKLYSFQNEYLQVKRYVLIRIFRKRYKLIIWNKFSKFQSFEIIEYSKQGDRGSIE
ncbi:unnamed protein product [Paramecium sonneborni]|uniref:Uncharacterized protein n=1 Tax=Paramecium sonneborni TaxID=65129 RepID=A0A8S1QWP6_9CILI|nr:unnamed protein product [Paramecium sonneborni]